MRYWVFITAFLWLMATPAFADDANDWQFWNTESAEVHLEEKYYGTVEQEFRFGDDFSNFYYTHTDGGVIHKTYDWLHLGANFRFIVREKDDEWEREYRPHVNATLLGEWQALNFSNRSRFEFRMLSDTKDNWRYRNKIRIDTDLQVADHTVTPYVADEYFADLDDSSFNFNRFSTGIEMALTKRVTGDLYYLWQDEEGRGTESASHVIGLNFHWEF
ncbi:MAG: DUF2490 domain-containing protein [Candidatus Omnitrophota bacterium]